MGRDLSCSIGVSFLMDFFGLGSRHLLTDESLAVFHNGYFSTLVRARRSFLNSNCVAFLDGKSSGRRGVKSVQPLTCLLLCLSTLRFQQLKCFYQCTTTDISVQVSRSQQQLSRLPWLFRIGSDSLP